MADLPFNQSILEWIADHRFEPLTTIFQFFTFLGNEMGYIMVVVAIYWLFDKKIALRATVLLILSSALNQILKNAIANKRPFVDDGTYEENWAIPSSDIEDRVQEYSTPSNHAMGSASFWGYVHLKIKSRNTLILASLMILMVGLSRPYLGVHYFEDVILGWLIGFLILYVVLRFEDRLSSKWNSIDLNIRNLTIIIVVSTAWLIAGILDDWGYDSQQLATLGGMITGLLIGAAYEEKFVQFKPSIGSIPIGILKYMLGIVLCFATLIGLDEIFIQIADDDTPLGFVLRYIRYTTLGIVGTLVVGWIYIKLGLAEKETIKAE